MRTRLQQLYDRFYYGFERLLVVRSAKKHVKKSLRGVKPDPAFEEAYRTSIRPYWAKYGVHPAKCWFHEIYRMTGSTDPRYLPTDVYALHILPHFNNTIFVRPLADKNLNGLMCPAFKRPETIFRHMSGGYCGDDFAPITKEEALCRLQKDGHYFIKPSRNSAEGEDILSVRCPRDKEKLPELLRRYEITDYIVQRAVIQHPDLAALNPSSVNTLRVITLVFRGQAHILSAILRVGASGSDVDNVGAGGAGVRVMPDGSLCETAYTHRSGTHQTVDRTADGVLFAGRSVPSFDRVRKAVLEAALHMPHLRYVAWDLAVDEAGDPVLIEFNAHVPGQNQATCGPTFGDMTEDVLAEVFQKP